MTGLLALATLLIAALLVALLRRRRRAPRRIWQRRRLTLTRAGAEPLSSAFPARKPDWVRKAVLQLHEHSPQSHRQLAHAFNRRYTAVTGVRVGRTWVRDLLLRHAHAALQARDGARHRVPPPLPRNHCWGIDTTQLRDVDGTPRLVLGLIDHGTRRLVGLHHLHRFNHWILLGHLCMAIGRFGTPRALRLDNHPVHHAQRFKRLVGMLGITLQFTQPASPWQNGRIERLFGTLKSTWQAVIASTAACFDQQLAAFETFYNEHRPHQHLQGRTPHEAWHGIDPFRPRPLRSNGNKAREGPRHRR